MIPGDIGEYSVIKGSDPKAIDALGSIDILVNSAAFQRTYEQFEDISDDEFEETYRVNVFAMLRLCKAILPQMKEGGSIINTGSIQSFDPSPNAQKEAKFRDAMFPLEMPREWVAGAERAFLAATRTCRRSGELAKLKAVAKWLLCRAQGATGCDPAVALRILAFDHREVRLDLCHVL